MSNLQTAVYDLKQFTDVYEPSEDSFLFLDALEHELAFLLDLQPACLVEIGSGSGVIITSLAKKLKNCSYFATDINDKACKATSHTATLNNVTVECTCMNLLASFKSNMFDVILFNPPYVVTSSQELLGSGLNRAWAGGRDGREIIDKLLPQIPKLLSARGVFYLLLLRENKPDEVIGILSDLHFRHCIVMEKKILGEYLYVIKFYK